MQAASDIFRPVYDATNGVDGRVEAREHFRIEDLARLVAARVSEALRWSLAMSEGTGYGLTAWIEPQESKDTRGVRVRASPSRSQRPRPTLFATKIYFFMRRLPAI